MVIFGGYPMTDDTVSLEQAIRELMDKGKTRRQAKAILIKMVKTGKLKPLTLDDEGRRVPLPPKPWRRKIN
jgi:hypothetical protein